MVAFVGVDDVAVRQPLDERRAGRAIGDVTAGEQEGNRPAERVGQRVDFCRSSAARAPDRLILLPPFPPAAER